MLKNLDGFKKVHEDKDKTVMQHPKGHTITIAHRPLKALQVKQLQALPLHKCDGGMISMANGGSVKNYAYAGEVTPENEPSADKQPDYTANPMSNWDRIATQDLPSGAATYPTENISPGQAAMDESGLGQQSQPASQDSNQSVQDSNSEVAETPQQSQSAAAASAPAGGVGSQDIMNNMQKDYAQNRADIAGVQQGAEAYYNPQTGAPAVIAQQQQQMQDLAKVHAANVADMQNEYNQIKQDYLNGHIDPKAYQKNMSAGEKTATAIGLFLGGLSTPFTHQGNPALEMLNKQIDRNIQGQKDDFEKGNTLLNANFAKYHNMQTAEDFTRLQMQAFNGLEMQKQAMKIGGPQAALAASNANLALDQGAGQVINQMALRQSVLAPGANVPLSTKIQYGLPKEQQQEAQKQASEYDSYLRAKSNVNDLMDQLDKEQTTGNLSNPQSYNRVNQIKAGIVQGIMETSPSKRLTKESIEAEIKPFEYGTSTTQQTRTAARKGINQLVDVHAGPMNILTDHGMVPKIGTDPTVGFSSADRAAFQEARLNPNNPKAQRVIQILKGKYGL